MTSTANPPNTNPAPTTSSAPSYASAAGATKKPITAPPVIAAASAPNAAPIVSGSASSSTPVNGGKTSAPSALPAIVGAPAIVHGGSASTNGNVSDHNRSASVTLGGNAPGNIVANGSAIGNGKSKIQFGTFADSPAPQHSAPQNAGAAPIPIPRANIPSPAHSPAPIPQPALSGGKPGATDNSFQIGSFTGDGDRQRPGVVSQNSNLSIGAQQNMDPRRNSNSNVSQHSDMSNAMSQGPMRGGFNQAGRGRGGYNPSFNNQMGYPPTNGNPYTRGPGHHAQGRGNMSQTNFGRGNMAYAGSPRNSPAPSHVQPHTPAMGQQTMQVPPLNPYGPQYGPPMNGGNYQQQPPQFFYDSMGRQLGPNGQFAAMGMPSYPPQGHHPGYPNPGQAPQFYNGAPYQTQQAQPMSRNNSQASERPASSTGKAQPPVVVSGATHTPDTKSQPPVVAAGTSSNFQRPRKSAALVIKDSSGKAIDLKGLSKTPASPASSIAQSKTPPAVASTPTPPPPTLPLQPPAETLHSRSESTARTAKSSDEVRNEFLKRVQESAGITATPASKSTEDDKASEADVHDAAPAEPKSVETQEAAEDVKAPQTEAESEKAAAPTTTVTTAAEDKVADKTASPVEKDDKVSAAPAEETEEEFEERMIREMEEEDAKREKKQAEITARKEAEKAAAKAEAEKEKKLSSADNDRKLAEAEREMERLEEEKEKKREAEHAASEGGTSEATKEKESSSVADKLAELSIASPSATPVEPGPPSAKSDKRPNKPAALNLTPLNTKNVEAPQPSAALMSLKSARFLSVRDDVQYPNGIKSPNPSLNTAVGKKGKEFKYDSSFLLQFQKVFTEQPSLEFGQQVKSLIGDASDGSRSAAPRGSAGGVGSSRQPSRSGNAFGGAMGTFSQPPAGQTLPRNTTSEQRFAMSSSSRTGAQPMASFGRPGSTFPGGSTMGRVPSTTNMGQPNSPRQGSRRPGGGGGAGGGSRRGGGMNQDTAAAAKTMPLTAGMDIKPIQVSATGWKPKVGQAATGLAPTGGAGQGVLLDPPTVQKKVKAALNKMTPEKFDKIADQILIIAAQSKDETDGRTLRQVIQLTFEKATDESHWASMYAKFCKRMHDKTSDDIKDETIKDKAGNVVSGGALFRKYLLNRCQEEFEKGWKTEMPEAQEGQSKEAVMLSDEYYVAAKAKRQGLGLIQFIGELFKLGMLTERIMHECLQRLLNFEGVPDEAEIESLTKLLRTVGQDLDASDKGRPRMEAYFNRINSIVNMPDLPSRLKFMLMDVVDLRRKRWETNDTLKGPKTLEEIRADAEAAAAQKAAENARASQRSQGGGGRMGGRGDSRNFPAYNQAPTNQVGVEDLRRLANRGSANRTASSTSTFGPSAMFTSRSSSGRRLGPGGALTRGTEDSASSSKNGTPSTRESSNAFAALAAIDPPDATSPPSTAASPALSKATPASDKKE